MNILVIEDTLLVALIMNGILSSILAETIEQYNEMNSLLLREKEKILKK